MGYIKRCEMMDILLMNNIPKFYKKEHETYLA